MYRYPGVDNKAVYASRSTLLVAQMHIKMLCDVTGFVSATPGFGVHNNKTPFTNVAPLTIGSGTILQTTTQYE